jgi:AbrB family looped-hinge helix DNA binding protein
LIDGGNVKTVTVSPKYQVVIPREVRESMSLKPDEKMQVINYADRIELVSVRKIKDMRGFLKGIDTTVEREKNRV